VVRLVHSARADWTRAPAFTAAPGTPSIDGLTAELLTHNRNSANPRRLDRSEAVTCDHDHNYGAEQKAFNGGQMDKFVENTGGGSCTDKRIVMAYYDGNTVTSLRPASSTRA
jgi:phospholipase C